MKLLYDNIVYSMQKYGGISAYWYELSKRALIDEAVDILFYECRDDLQNIFRQLLSLPSQTYIRESTTTPLIERFLRVHSPDIQSANNIFHSSYFRLPAKAAKCKKVCTVHDFIHDRFYKGSRLFLHNIPKRKCILESNLIITVSNHTKSDLINYYPQVNPDTVIPVYNGVSNLFKPVENKTTSGKPYLLFVGSRLAYKNFAFCVKLLEQMAEYDLYIVGTALSKAEEQELNNSIPGRFRSFTGIGITDLNILYNNAFCLLYPSSYEGFGIPLLEAMASGCPFIAYNSSSIPEVAGNAGFLLKNLNIDEGLHAIDSIQDNFEKYRQAGFERVKEFSWDKCYAETMKVYKKLI